jgi:hypothetical protein
MAPFGKTNNKNKQHCSKKKMGNKYNLESSYAEKRREMDRLGSCEFFKM